MEKFPRSAILDGRTPASASVGPMFSLAFVAGFVLLAASSAHAAGTPEQRRACTPDVYRLCPGEIPNVRAITACLRRQRASLSEACRAAFDQADTNPPR
jgi:hypothetical protein